MATTGTGTQADPYIVDTWSNFVTAVGTSGAYVEVMPETVWDFNSIAPEGVSQTTVRCAHINGNGAIINNARITNESLLYVSSGLNSTTIENLNILNVLADYYVLYNSGAPATLNLNRVVFSGILNNTALIYQSGNTINVRECGFALRGSASSIYTIRQGYIYHNDCNLNIDLENIGEDNLGRQTSMAFENSYLSGKCSGINLWTSATNNVINVETAVVSATQSNMNIANSDKCGALTNVIAVTDEQMKDAAYLSSIGFPIGAQP